MIIARPLFSFILANLFLSAGANDDTEIYERLESILSYEQAPTVRVSPISSLREIVVGSSIFYLSEDGRYLFQGDLIDLHTRKNLTEISRDGVRKSMFETINEATTINFLSQKIESRNKIYVFTDIDCGYCRKLHLEVPGLNDAGVTVSYLSYPRSGLEGESYEKAVDVWCSTDRNKALTRAKLGKKIARHDCDSPVEKHYNLGKAIGLKGTPAIYTKDGFYLGAYATSESLLQQLASLKK